MSKRANWPVPNIPELVVTTQPKSPPQALKPEYVSPEDMASFRWQEAANADELAHALLRALVPPGSSPDFVAELVPVVAKNWGEGSLPVIAQILKETSDTDVAEADDKEEKAA